MFGLPVWFGVVCVLPLLTISAFWVVNRPNVFPYIYVLILSMDYFKPNYRIGDFFTVAKLVPMFLLVTYVLNFKRKKRLQSYKIFIPAILLAFYFSISVWWSVDPQHNIYRALTFPLLLVSYWFVASFAQDDHVLWHFLGAFVWLSIVLSVISIIYFMENFSGTALLRTRPLNLNTNIASLFIGLGMFPLIVVRLRRMKVWKWLPDKWHLFIILLNVCGILTTASIGGVVSFLSGIMILFVLKFMFEHRNILKVIFGAAILTFLVLRINEKLHIVDNYYSRLELLVTEPNPAAFETVGSRRLDFWREGWQLFLEKPLTGNGIRSYVQQGTFGTVTHNSFIWALAEGGIIGGTLWILLLVTAGLSLIKTLRLARQNRDVQFEGSALVLIAMLASCIAYSMTHNIEYNKIFWVVLAMSESLWGMSRHRFAVLYKPFRRSKFAFVPRHIDGSRHEYPAQFTAKS